MQTSSSASRSTSMIRRWRDIQPSVEPLTSTSSMIAMSRRARRCVWYSACGMRQAGASLGLAVEPGVEVQLVAVELAAQALTLGAQHFEVAADRAQQAAVAFQRRVHPLRRAGGRASRCTVAPGSR